MSNKSKYYIFLFKMFLFYVICIFIMYWLYNWNMLYTIKVVLFIDKIWWYLYSHIRIEVTGFEDISFDEFDVIKYLVYFIIFFFIVCKIIYWFIKGK